jgi:hypothetical protein
MLTKLSEGEFTFSGMISFLRFCHKTHIISGSVFTDEVLINRGPGRGFPMDAGKPIFRQIDQGHIDIFRRCFAILSEVFYTTGNARNS